MTPDPTSISAAWTDAQARLPEGWSLDSLRCASTGLTPDERSDEWIAVAIGPGGEERTCQAADVVGALDGLARTFESA